MTTTLQNNAPGALEGTTGALGSHLTELPCNVVETRDGSNALPLRRAPESVLLLSLVSGGALAHLLCRGASHANAVHMAIGTGRTRVVLRDPRLSAAEQREQTCIAANLLVLRGEAKTASIELVEQLLDVIRYERARADRADSRRDN